MKRGELFVLGSATGPLRLGEAVLTNTRFPVNLSGQGEPLSALPQDDMPQ